MITDKDIERLKEEEKIREAELRRDEEKRCNKYVSRSKSKVLCYRV